MLRLLRRLSLVYQSSPKGVSSRKLYLQRLLTSRQCVRLYSSSVVLEKKSKESSMEEALAKLHSLPNNSPEHMAAFFNQALRVLLILVRQWTKDRADRGFSTKDTILGYAPFPNVIPLEALFTVEAKITNWADFFAIITLSNPTQALQVMIKLFLQLPTRTSEQYSRLISASGELYQIRLAQRLFNMAEADLKNRFHPIIHEAMLGCYARMYDYSSARALFQEMNDREVPVTVASYIQLLEAFVKAIDLELTNRIKAETEKAYVRNRQPFMEHVLEEQTRLVDISPALDIYRQVLHNGFKPTIRIFTLLLLLASRLRNNVLAEKVLSEMSIFKITPDEHVCGIVTQLYASSGKVKRAEEFLNEFCRRRNTRPTIYSLNALLASYTRVGNARDALRIFELTKECTKPSFLTFSMLYGMYLELDRLSDALDVLDQMKMAGFEPTRHNYNHLLSYYYKKNLYNQFFSLIDYMREIGIDGGKYSRAMTIGLYGRHGKVEELKKFWQNIKDEKSLISLTEYSYFLRYLLTMEDDETLRDVVKHLNRTSIFTADSHFSTRTFLYAFTRVSDYDAAYTCLDKLYEEQHQADVHLFNVVLQGIAVDQQINEATRFSTLMERVGCGRSHTSYVLLVYLAGEVGNLALIESLWREYRESGLTIMGEPVKSVMAALIKNNLAKRAMEIFEEVKEHSPTILSEALYAFYIEALVYLGRIEQAFLVLDEMEERLMPALVRTFNIILDYYSRAGDAEGFELVLKRMTDKAVQPNKYSYALGVRLKVALDQFDEAERLVSELESNDAQVAIPAKVYLISGLLKHSCSIDDSYYKRAQALSSQVEAGVGVGGVVVASPPSPSLYTSWIYYYVRIGERKRALQTFDSFLAQGLTPDANLSECMTGISQSLEKQ